MVDVLGVGDPADVRPRVVAGVVVAELRKGLLRGAVPSELGKMTTKRRPASWRSRQQAAAEASSSSDHSCTVGYFQRVARGKMESTQSCILTGPVFSVVGLATLIRCPGAAAQIPARRSVATTRSGVRRFSVEEVAALTLDHIFS